MEKITLNQLVGWAAQLEAVVSQNALGFMASRALSELAGTFEKQVKSNPEIQAIITETKRLIAEGLDEKRINELREQEKQIMESAVQGFDFDPVVVSITEEMAAKIKTDVVHVAVAGVVFQINPYSALHGLLRDKIILLPS